MTTWKWLVAGILLSSTVEAQTAVPKAVEPPAAAEDIPLPKPAESQIVAVTVYQTNALITRDVAVPEGKGVFEVVVTPLPAGTLDGSLYSEGAEGLRVLSTRYRTRAVKEDTRESVRAKNEQIKSLESEAKTTHGELGILEENLKFLQKLENFTGATLNNLTEKGRLDSDATLSMAKFVMETRAEKSSASMKLEQRALANIEAIEFAKRQLAELSSGSRRTEIDAVIVIDKANAPAASVRLNYLVASASWTPRYRFRAGGPKDPVRLEFLAAVEQQSGEDWNNAEITLSTAQPSFNATLPDLLPLDVMVASGEEPNPSNVGGFHSLTPEQTPDDPSQAQAREMRGRAGREIISNNAQAGGALLNQAAALDQARELLANDDAKDPNLSSGELPSVTHHLKGRLSIPSRRDPLFVEISRSEMAADYFDKAAPVLSSRVYRLAKLTNSGNSVILPGEATMFVGTDFVGRMTVPLVAVGEPFIVGFGVDPRLQIGRRLTKKSRSVQGGNNVQTYEFRITARNFGDAPVKLHVWDRLPKPSGDAIAVNLVESSVKPSDDPLYQRVGRPDNLLRWDLDIPANTTGEKALAINYTFKLEYAREVDIDSILGAGIREAPIGGMRGMGGMGGGMGGMRSVGEQRP